MTDTTEAAGLLRQAAEKFKAAAAARDQAADELADAIRAADDAGLARNEIVRVAGIARNTVYRAFGKQYGTSAADLRQQLADLAARVEEEDQR